MKSVVGIVPAAGHATRLPAISGSKEVLPLPPPWPGHGLEYAIDPLLESFSLAGIRRAVILLRAEKRDIPKRLGGRRQGVELSYETVGATRSVVETIARAPAWLEGATVALGFPDILVSPADAFVAILRRLETTGADAALGLFPNDFPTRSDMVHTDAEGRVQGILVKSLTAKPGLSWMLAAWRPSFTRLLRDELAAHGPWTTTSRGRRERYPGDVLNAALAAGLRLEAVAFPRGGCLDFGTPEDLARVGEFGRVHRFRAGVE